MSRPFGMRVLYFTAAPIYDTADGGRICQRNTIRRLSQDPDIELSAVVAGRPAWREGTEAHFESLAIPHEFVPFFEDNVYHSENSVRAIANLIVRTTFQFPWEVQSFNQPQVDGAVKAAIASTRADLLLIEFLASALFINLPRSEVRTAMLKLDREAEFYAGLLEHDEWLHGSLTRWLSLKRLARFERKTDGRVGKVIVLSPTDLPSHETQSTPICITPHLDREANPWRFTDSHSAFFVGNVHHYPNRRALEWIAVDLAPRLRAHREDARLIVIGADSAEVPPDWRQPNVEFQGRADDATVDELFRAADLTLVPIDNDLGVKIKAAQAVAYGTPLLASLETLKGLPYLRGRPPLPLRDPDAAAAMVARLIGNRQALMQQSENQSQDLDRFAATQRDVWSKALRDVPAPNPAGTGSPYPP